MTKFGESLNKPKEENKNTFTSEYVRTTEEHQTVIRILDEEPIDTWSHFIPKGHHAFPNANAGKAISVMCPGMSTCPVCSWNRSQKSLNPDTKDLLKASKKYTFNVIDRTPVVVCTAQDGDDLCGNENYEINNVAPKVCSKCGAALTGKLEPRNTVKIMQKGINFIKQLGALETEDFGENGDLRTFDIKVTTRGSGRDSTTTCIPKPSTESIEDILGENWEERKHNIIDVVKPLDPDNVQRVLDGESFWQVAKGNGNTDQ